MRRFPWSVGLLLGSACNGQAAPANPAPAPTPPPTSRPVASTPPSAVSSPTVADAESIAADAAAPRDARAEAPPDMLPVPGGKFVMGADDVGEQDERPAHEVTIPGFFLDKTEVTNRAYQECIEAGACKPYRPEPSSKTKGRWFHGPEQPVVGVSWFQARDFCRWRGKRLPTEAEFEKASRDTDGRIYPWGNEKPDNRRHAQFGHGLGGPGGATRKVGSFPEGAGPYGHLDLAGNVWEWVEDEYDPFAYKRDTAGVGKPGSCEEILRAQDSLRRNGQQGYTGTNPIPTECEHVLRGGAFNYHARGLRASNRVHHPGGWRLVMAGFRCAKDL